MPSAARRPGRRWAALSVPSGADGLRPPHEKLSKVRQRPPCLHNDPWKPLGIPTPGFLFAVWMRLLTSQQSSELWNPAPVPVPRHPTCRQPGPGHPSSLSSPSTLTTLGSLSVGPSPACSPSFVAVLGPATGPALAPGVLSELRVIGMENPHLHVHPDFCPGRQARMCSRLLKSPCCILRPFSLSRARRLPSTALPVPGDGCSHFRPAWQRPWRRP